MIDLEKERDLFDMWHFLNWKLNNAVTDSVEFAKNLYDRVYSHYHTLSVREIEFAAWLASANRDKDNFFANAEQPPKHDIKW